MSYITQSGLSIPTSDAEVIPFIRDWYDSFHADCPKERDTTYYIGQGAAGSAAGGGGAGTEADPYLVANGDQWTTLVGTLLAANVRIRSRRGDWFVSSGNGIDTSLSNITFDSFGDANKPNPLFVRGQWISAAPGTWVNAAGHRWYVNPGNTIIGLRIARTDFRRVWEYWEHAASTTIVQSDVSSNRLWHYTAPNCWVNDTIGRYGVVQWQEIDPNDYDWFLYSQNAHSLLTIRGSGCRIEGIDCEGWGIGSDNNQAHGIKISTINHTPCVVKNCQLLYGNVHVVGANHGHGLPGEPIGAATLWEGVEFGWSYPSTAAATHHNTFAKSGEYETLAINCWDVAGIIKTSVSSGTQGISFNGHTANGTKRGYQVFLNCGRRSLADIKLNNDLVNSSNHYSLPQINRQHGLAIGLYDDDVLYDDPIMLIEAGLSIPNVDPQSVFSADSSGVTTLLSRITGLLRTKDADEAADEAITDAINAIDGDATAEDATEIAQLVADRLSGHVVVSWPVVANGRIRTPVIRGDDYLAANDRQFRWTVPAPIGAADTSSVCKFGATHESTDDAFVVEGTIIADGADWHLDFDLTQDNTEPMPLGWYSWSVEVRDAAGNEMTQLYGKFQMIRKHT